MRVLLVEDYPPLRKSVAKGLRQAGYAVDVADNGDDGLWMARGNSYDVILLDLMIPGVDGLTLLRALRSEGRESHVLILTARDSVPDRVEGLSAGADDYLVKPFAFEELLARVQALVRRGYGPKSPLVVVGSLRVDTSARRAWRDGHELQLTAREYALLEYLAMRRGEVVSRSEIWEHIYEFDSSTASNVVDVYVGYLRRKIDPSGKPSLIRTVRGRGYSLEGEPC